MLSPSSPGIFASLSVGGIAHLNCAVTLALVMAGVTPVSQVPGLVAGQFAGAFVGADSGVGRLSAAILGGDSG